MLPRDLQNLIEGGESVFITGRAGTGKTWLLRKLIEYNRDKGRSVAVTAPTGMAAVNCEGQTLHGVFHFPVRRGNHQPTVITKNDRWFKQLAENSPSWGMDLLFIDEISMVRADLLEALDKALRKYGPRPGVSFGGVQVIVFGDPLQLPPIVKPQDRKWFRHPHWHSEWFFSTRAFRMQGFHHYHLKRNFRQIDPGFASILDRVRLGEANDDDLAFLRTLCRLEPCAPHALHLFCRKPPAVAYNNTQIARLNGTSHLFEAHVHHDWNGDDPVERRILLKVGARVMLRANLDVGSGWVNGTLGSISDIDREAQQILMTKDDGSQLSIGPNSWEHDLPRRSGERFERKATFTQIPVEPAWAFTIHKMQGQTVDGPVVLHPENPFDYGQLYVGLSRVRQAAQLTLTSHLPAEYLKPNWKARDFLALKNALA